MKARLRSLGEMSPQALASVVALGLVFGVFPAPVCPTVFCALAAIVLRLNAPAIQLVNYLAYPLQLALMVPFGILGGRWFGTAGGAGPMGHPGVVWRFAAGLCTASVHAAQAWFCVCVPLGVLLYAGLAIALRRWAVRAETIGLPATA